MPRSRVLGGAAARVALGVLAQELAAWVRARRRLGRRQTSDALHDFRVALRRLRSTLRAFAPQLELPTGLRGRLRRLARDTNESRNLEIWQHWVAAQARQLSPRQAIGVRWLQARLHTRKRRADARMRRVVQRSFHELRREVEAVRGAAASRGSGQAAVAGAVREGRRELRALLRRVHSLRDREPAHEARIAAKRLRYLLEPFGDEIAGGEALVLRLERLQDLLGEVHDAHVFADELRDALSEVSERRSRRLGHQLLPWPAEDPAPGSAPPAGARAGLLALARRLRSDGEERFERFREERRRGTVDEVLRGLLAVGRTRGGTHRGGRI